MKKWKLLNSSQILKSKWLNVFINSYKLPNGRIVDNYYNIEKQDCVVVIGVKRGLIGVIKQYRRGVHEIVYELPAGLIEKGKTIIETATSELMEETGYTGNAKFLTSTLTQPAFSSMKSNFVFIEITGFVGVNLGFDEDIQFEFMSFEKINSLIKSGDITDLSFIAGMHLFTQFISK